MTSSNVGHGERCTHAATPVPGRPVPDWTGRCPDCGEGVKHDGCGGFITVRENNARAAHAARSLRLVDLVADLRDDQGKLDSVIGQAVSDAQMVGSGDIATARAVREALAEHFAAAGQEGAPNV